MFKRLLACISHLLFSSHSSVHHPLSPSPSHPLTPPRSHSITPSPSHPLTPSPIRPPHRESVLAVTAGFLGWTLDAFDFFLVVISLPAIGATSMLASRTLPCR